MKIIVDDQTSLVSMSHNGATIDWYDFNRPNNWEHNPNELFTEINGFWASLPNETQDELWAIYLDVYDLFKVKMDVRILIEKLQPKFVFLLDELHSVESLGDYLQTVTIKYPDNVDEVFDSDLERKSRELTYTKSEYFDLVVATVALRAIMPIWESLLIELNPTGSRANFYASVDLLRTLIDTEFQDCPALKRLEVYVEAAYLNINKKPNKLSQLSVSVAGPGTDDLIYYLYSVVVCTRLMTTPINNKKPQVNLISAVYMRVKQDIRRLPDVFNERVAERRDDRMGLDGSDKIGYFESYSTRQRVSDEVPITNGEYLLKLKQFSARYNKDIPYSLVKECVNYFIELDFDVLNKDVFLTQIIVAPTIMHASIPDIDNRRAMMNAMGLATAAMIHYGLHDVAKILVMRPIENEECEEVFTPMLPVSPQLIEKLDIYYPYRRPSSNSSSKNPKRVNMGILSIDEYCTFFVTNRWKIEANKTLLDLLQCEAGEWQIPRHIKTKLAEAYVIINEHLKKEFDVCEYYSL